MSKPRIRSAGLPLRWAPAAGQPCGAPGAASPQGGDAFQLGFGRGGSNGIQRRHRALTLRGHERQHPALRRNSASSPSSGISVMPSFRERTRGRCSGSRRERLTPPIRQTSGGLMPGLISTRTFSQTASNSPARMRARSSPLLARCVMSVLRMTGQRPESGAGFSTSAHSSLASSMSSENRSTSWRRKLPVPWEQRLFSRKTSRPLARSSSTEKPWLPMETIGGRLLAEKEAVAARLGLLGRDARQVDLPAHAPADRGACHAIPIPIAQRSPGGARRVLCRAR